MKRFLPPLVVVLLLGVVVWRVAHDDQREREREQLIALWGLNPDDPTLQQEAVERTLEYVERYGHLVEDRWFAARSLLKSGVPVAAVDVVWQEPAIREADGAGARFGRLVLQTTGFSDDEELKGPRGAAGIVTSMLADGGDARALELIAAEAVDEPWSEVRDLFYATNHQGAPRVRDAVTEAMRARGDDDGRLAAAILAAGPEPYPEREADLRVLLDAVTGPIDEDGRLLWSSAARALGKMEAPEGLAALEQVVEARKDSEVMLERADAAMAAIGLVAGGRLEAAAAGAEFLPPQRDEPLFVDAYLQALLHRLRRGDAEAGARILELWRTSSPVQGHTIRPQAAHALFLLGEEVPGVRETFAAELEELATSNDATEQVVSAAIRLRDGERAARDDLVQAIQDLGRMRAPLVDPELANPFLFHPLLQAARALLLYDR